MVVGWGCDWGRRGFFVCSFVRSFVFLVVRLGCGGVGVRFLFSVFRFRFSAIKVNFYGRLRLRPFSVFGFPRSREKRRFRLSGFRFPGSQNLLQRPRLEQRIVVCVSAYPKPEDAGFNFYAEGPVLQSYSYRSKSAYLFEMEGRMLRACEGNLSKAAQNCGEARCFKAR